MILSVSVIGPTGQIGSEVCLQFPIAAPIFKSKLDLRNQYLIKEVLASEKFDILINCAGITDLGFCEENPETASVINTHSVKEIAEFCLEHNKYLFHISDSMIFDGISSKPYDINSKPNPINFYGRSKAEAEYQITKIMKRGTYSIIRTSSVFGPALGRSNFIEKIIASGMRCKEFVKIPSWRYITPTPAKLVAKTISAILGEGHSNISDGLPPIVHVACSGGAITQSEVAAFVLANIPSLAHMKVTEVVKPGKGLPRVPAVTALEPSLVAPPLGLSWQNSLQEYLLQKGYARPVCAIEVENDVDRSVTKVWERLQRGVVPLDALVEGLRKDRANWMAGIEGPNRKASKGFWAKFGDTEEEKQKESE